MDCCSLSLIGSGTHLGPTEAAATMRVPADRINSLSLKPLFGPIGAVQPDRSALPSQLATDQCDHCRAVPRMSWVFALTQCWAVLFAVRGSADGDRPPPAHATPGASPRESTDSELEFVKPWQSHVLRASTGAAVAIPCTPGRARTLTADTSMPAAGLFTNVTHGPTECTTKP